MELFFFLEWRLASFFLHFYYRMDENLGSGLTAKCVTTPRLNCRTHKKKLDGSPRKYVSKIINKPGKEHIDLEMYYRELLISKKIADEAIKKDNGSKEWLDSRFAVVYESCLLDKSVNKERSFKACELEDDTDYFIVFSINGGCKYGDPEVGEMVTYFNKELNSLITGEVDSIEGDNYLVNIEDQQINLPKSKLVKTCGVLNNKNVMLNYFARIKGIRMRFKYILESIQFLHSIGIAHLDIKRDNLIADPNGVIRVIDFGASLSLFGENEKFFSKLCKKMKTHKFSEFNDRFREGLLLKIAVHTPGYVSPEFQLCSDLLGKKKLDMVGETRKISKKSNVKLSKVNKQFLLDLNKNKKQFMIDMFCGTDGKPPALFMSDVYSLGTVFKKIIKETNIKNSKLNNLISRMRDPVYQTRITIDECLNHPFFKSN